MQYPTRIVYAAGPGDVAGTFAHWKQGADDPSQVAVTYSGQFFDVARDIGADAYVISSHATRQTIHDGPFRIEHCPPPPFQRRGGPVLYHLGQIYSNVRLLWKAWRFGAQALVVFCGTGHWFVLRLAPLLGIKVIPTFHCVLWSKAQRPSRVQRFFNRLAAPLFRKSAAGILSTSHDIDEQVVELTGGTHRPIYSFLPSYRREQFAGIAPASDRRSPFRVFYAGRIERKKGVFDLLEIAKRYERDGRTDVEFDLCGTGSAMDELTQAVTDAGPGVAARFRLHGHCDRTTMRRMFAGSHVVIVPTSSDFVEGFNQVVAEAVLSGRPVVTSSVCPALAYVRDAVVEVPPDDVQAYGDAVLKLCDDRSFYAAKAESCRAAQGQFYDARRGWGASLKRVLRRIDRERNAPAPAAPHSPSRRRGAVAHPA